jgi:hypothetical protein
MGAKEPIFIKEPRPASMPQESTYLSFVHDTPPVFIVPDFIIYSAKINRYVSFRSEIGALDVKAEVMWTASDLSEAMEWYTLKSLREKYGPMDLGFCLIIYVDHRLKATALIADSERICRPDLILVCIGQDDPFAENWERASFYKRVLKPRRGLFILSKGSVRESLPDAMEEDMNFIEVGFNRSKMGFIINALTSRENT